MALQIPAERMQQYQRTARVRHKTEEALRDQRYERALEAARQAASLLKEHYGVQRVVVFGSLTHSGRFTRWSDVDLAAWGLTLANWLRAMAAVHALSDEIDINLVDMACCSPDLAACIEHDEVPL